MAVRHAASLLASLTALVIPEVCIGLLGLVPIGIGVYQLRDLWSDGLDDDEPVRTASGGYELLTQPVW